MESQLSSGDLISERYANALFELSSEKKIVSTVLENLEILQKIIKNNNELKILIKSPLISSNDKLVILLKLLDPIKINEITETFIKVISKNKRFSKLSSIISQFIKINAQKRGDILADITSADQLNEEQQKKIKENLKNILGNKLSLNFKVDKKIIGGLIIKVGSKMIDTSVANKINKLKIVMKGA